MQTALNLSKGVDDWLRFVAFVGFLSHRFVFFLLYPQIKDAWKRFRLIGRELDKLTEKIKPHIMEGRSHEEACDAMVQEMFVRDYYLLSALCLTLLFLHYI